MKKLLLISVLALSLWAPAWSQPWLECAEKYLPAVVEPGMRQELEGALVHAYARNGEFAHAQALIDAEGEAERTRFGVLAALGALRGGHLDQALRWAELYLPKEEPDWNNPRAMAVGSDRERFLRTARNPEDAARVLEFLRAHGGVSPSSLSFVLREAGGMPVAVADFYLREFAKVGDSARPVDWVQIEETADASGDEFQPLADRTLSLLLEQRGAVVESLLVTNPDVSPEQMDLAMRKYAAALLARRGRFGEADELWQGVGSVSPPETEVYLQEQWIGGRSEALAELARGGLEEDARVKLSQLLFRLGRYEQARTLGTDPDDYIDLRLARVDLARGEEVERWLVRLAAIDKEAKPDDSALYQIAVADDMPASVRERALALLPDAAASKALCQESLNKALRRTAAADSNRVSLMLLSLDEEISESGCKPNSEGLSILDTMSSKAPILKTP